MDQTTPDIIPRFIAHRGAPFLAPENTLSSLKAAAEAGVQWVEFDVQLSSDHQVMVFHDDTLHRMTGVRGRLKKHTCAELQALDIGSGFSDAFKGEGMPTLAQWLRCAAQLSIGVNIELKGHYEYRVLVEKTLACIKQHWPPHLPTPLLSSFNLKTLRHIMSLASGVPFAVNLHRWPLWLPTMIQHPDCYSVHLNYRIATPKRVKRLLSLGKRVVCYTVNDPATAHRLFAIGVSSVFTDDVAIMTKQVK